MVNFRVSFWRKAMCGSRRRVYRNGLLGLGLIAAATQLVSQPAAVDFKKDVQPILAQNCAVCHSGDSAVAGLHLDSGQGILTGSANGKVIVPGNPKDSLLIQRITEKSMPPSGPLSDDQIKIIRTWVEEG